MDHSSQGRRWRTRPILLGALVVALLATFAMAPTQAQTRVGAMLQTLTSWLWPTRWVWPLAAVLTLAALNTSQARRRWPQPTRRALAGISMLVGLIGLASLATVRRPLMGLLALGVVVALGLLANWVLVVPRQVAPHVPADVLEHIDDDRARLEVADARIKLQNDLRTTALGAIAGLAVLAGAVLGFQQLTEDRQQATATRQLTLQGQASERFTRAIDQLGSDRQEVQLGGIYGLEQIAQQAPANRLAVTEVLVAYLRRRSLAPTKSPPRGPDRPISELRIRAADVQAALTVLGRRQSAPDDPPLNLVALDLRHADLRSADLRRANLNFADLRRVDLRAAVLSGADLSEADLLVADLRAADFRRAIFRSARLSDVELSDADLGGAILRGAELRRTKLRSVNLRGAELVRASLTQADLRGADLQGADLQGAGLRLADLRGANLRGANLRGATADPATKWPDGFDWQGAGVRTPANATQ